MLVVHSIDSAAYRAGGNTIVIWPTPPTGTIVDTLYKQTYVIVFNDLSDLSSEPILIYPNPATERFFIQSENPIEQVRIFDLNGRLILNSGKSPFVPTYELQTGTYLVEIELVTGAKRHSKIVIQH